MAKSKTYPIIIYGTSTIKIYKDYAELVLVKGETVLIDNDTETLNFVKDRKWHIGSRNIVVSNTPNYVTLSRYICNAQQGQYVVYKNSNSFDCRKNNLTISTTSNGRNKDILNYEYNIEYDSTNNTAKVRVTGNTSSEDVIITVDESTAKDIASGKIHPYCHIEQKTISTPAKIKIPIKEYEKGDCLCSNLGRYVLGLEKGNPKQAYHIDDDRTNFLKSNLIALESSEYANFVKDREGYARKKRQEQQAKKPSSIKKLITKPESTTKTPKGVVDIGNGFFFVSIYNEKTDTLDQIGTFSNKEEACLAYEKRVREICEELARDAYESLVASLMEQYYE